MLTVKMWVLVFFMYGKESIKIEDIKDQSSCNKLATALVDTGNKIRNYHSESYSISVCTEVEKIILK